MRIKVVTAAKYPTYKVAELNVTIKEYRQLSDLLHDYFRHGILEYYRIDILKATDDELDELDLL